VWHALVVSAGRHRDDAAGDHAGHANDTGRHDAPSSAGNAAGFGAPAAGHVFCLTALTNGRGAWRCDQPCATDPAVM